jgi:hypothetical protein
MSLRFTKEQFKGGLQQATGGKPFFKVQKALKEAGLDKLLHQPSVSKDQFRKAMGALREQGVAYRQTGEVIRTTERKIAAEAKPGEKPKEKMTPAEFRAKMAEEKKHKEEVEKRIAAVRGERLREEAGAGKSKTATSALRATAKTSALEPQKGPGRPETTTSALRKPAAPKPAEEKPKPTAIDLPID